MVRNRLTRLGVHFAFVATFAMVGGSIRGLNLLLIIAAACIGALMIQWRMGKRMLESVNTTRRLPGEAFAGRSFRVRYPVTNRSRFLPAWMLRIQDVITPAEAGSESAWFKRRSGHSPVTVTTGVGLLGPGQTIAAHYDCRIMQRGQYKFGPITTSSLFPLHLLRSFRTSTTRETLDVYPRLLTLRRGWQSKLLVRGGASSVRAGRTGLDDGEFFGLREYQRGDNPKWIHWRTTARTGDLSVRQFEQLRRYDVCVLLDAYRPPPSDSQVTGQDTHDVPAETAISLAASLLLDLSTTVGNRIVLAAAGEESQAVMGGAAFETRRRMFGLLARTKLTEQPDLTTALHQSIEAVGVAQDLIVVSPRDRASACNQNAALVEMLRGWGRRGTVIWMDVTTDSVKQLFTEQTRSAEQALSLERVRS